jgi:molybdopterin synthase sulfur carrier subunit
MMETKIILFGSLLDDVGASSIDIILPHDTDSLLSLLQQQYPILNERKFLISVDRKIINGNTAITASSEIALLPPFSGG